MAQLQLAAGHGMRRTQGRVVNPHGASGRRVAQRGVNAKDSLRSQRRVESTRNREL